MDGSFVVSFVECSRKKGNSKRGNERESERSREVKVRELLKVKLTCNFLGLLTCVLVARIIMWQTYKSENFE